jgi:cytochrome c oxidase cbb3-type subunit 2
MKLDFHKNHRLLFGTVFGVFVILTLIIAVWPAWWVQSNNRPLPGTEPLTALERKGLQVYVSEGCVYCHTQQVRPLPQDTSRYGRASAPGDYARLEPTGPWRQTPSVLGTERTGPDLSNIGERQPSATWHHIHLYQPRAVVEGSVMPAHPWLYRVEAEPDSGEVVVPVPTEHAPESGQVVATEEARALVAYLQSLRQSDLRSDTDTTSSGQADGPSEGPAGARVYASRCASCHQPDGQGVEGVYPPLAGDPVVTAEEPAEHIRIVLFGLQGKAIGGVSYSSAMPGWGDRLSNEEVAAVVNHERTSWGNDAPTVTADDVAEIREEGAPDGG